MRDFLIKMGSLDRRWIFLLIALAVIIPLLLELDAAMPASPIVRGVFDKVEELIELLSVHLRISDASQGFGWGPERTRRRRRAPRAGIDRREGAIRRSSRASDRSLRARG